jgi:hypothetical protein
MCPYILNVQLHTVILSHPVILGCTIDGLARYSVRHWGYSVDISSKLTHGDGTANSRVIRSTASANLDATSTATLQVTVAGKSGVTPRGADIPARIRRTVIILLHPSGPHSFRD